jgi:hypothetical protein
MKIKDRLSILCYGDDLKREDVLKKQWMKRRDVYYPKTK